MTSNSKKLPVAKKSFRSRQSKGDIAFEIIVVILLALLTLTIIYPLYFVVIASFSDAKAVVGGKVILLPVSVTLENYKECFKNGDLMLGYGNSFQLLIYGTAVYLFLTILCAYPLSRKDLWGRNGIMVYCTIPMFFGGGLIPTYLLVTKTLGLSNSWWAVILVGGVSTYNMIIMRTFFMSSIPFELQEAAEIDGCSPLRTLISIILPLSKPIILTIALYYGVGFWNDFMHPLLYLNDSSLQPLPILLRNILMASGMNEYVEVNAFGEAPVSAIKTASVFMSAIPMIIAYPFIQKYFTKGTMLGSVKG